MLASIFTSTVGAQEKTVKIILDRVVPVVENCLKQISEISIKFDNYLRSQPRYPFVSVDFDGGYWPVPSTIGGMPSLACVAFFSDNVEEIRGQVFMKKTDKDFLAKCNNDLVQLKKQGFFPVAVTTTRGLSHNSRTCTARAIKLLEQ